MFPFGPIFYLFLFIRVISVIASYALLQYATKTVLNRHIGALHKRTKSQLNKCLHQDKGGN